MIRGRGRETALPGRPGAGRGKTGEKNGSVHSGVDSPSQHRDTGSGGRPQEPEDTARRLIRAGRRLFSTRGFDGTSVRALTREAGTNLGAITYHFHSKEVLYHRVLEEVLGPVREHLEMVRGLPFSAPQRLEFFIRGMFQHLRENPETPRFFVQEIVLGEEPAPAILANVQVVVTVLTGVIQEGQAVGTIRKGDPMLMALSTLSQPLYLSLMPRVLAREDLRKAGLPQPRSNPEDHAVEFVLGSLLARKEERE